jgi:hypothetical protein
MCEATLTALATGAPADPAHLASCPRCARAAGIVASLTPNPSPMPVAVPSIRTLRARTGVRRAVGPALVALAASVLLAAWPEPESPAPPPDMFAALDVLDGDDADLDSLDAVALLDPWSDDETLDFTQGSL